MPLIRLQSLNHDTLLGLWHVTEDAEPLKDQLLALRPQLELPDFKSAARMKEWLASRVLAYTLLTELTAEPAELKKYETGQPYLEGVSFHVSLTHSGNWVAVLISGSYQVGIDLELKGYKVDKLAPRFLNEDELSYAAQDSDKLHLYWSAKETLYKVYSRRQLLFKEQLLLQNFEKNTSGQFEGQILTDEFNQRYNVHYELAADYVLTYVLAPLN